MNIETKVCSLDRSRRLKEFEVIQESLFYWADGSLVISIDMDLLLDNGKVRSLSPANNSWPDQDIFDLYSAFLVSEIEKKLPEGFVVYRKKDGGYGAGWPEEWNDKLLGKLFCKGKTLVDGYADILLYLLENDLINK